MGDTPFGPGTVLAGRFTLDDLLDDTDGARFWRATDTTLARSVAVHVLADSDPRAESLLTAARTSALVSDGHLLRVLDAAAEDGVVYVVNEWGSGVSLDRMLVEGPLSPRRAAWVVKEVAEAIATAHRNGVAHGRLLPEKVMVTEAGSVKLIGFVVDAVLQDRAGRDQVRVTGGDPMSAHESDVVNLAALLYAALVGRWPGTEGSTVPPAPAEHGRPLRPRQVRAGVPRPLDAICERVLNAGPHTHAVPIETAHEVYAALSDYIGDPAGAPQYEATAVLDTSAAVPARRRHRAGDPAQSGRPARRGRPDGRPGHRGPRRDGSVPGAAEGLRRRRRPDPGRGAGLLRRGQRRRLDVRVAEPGADRRVGRRAHRRRRTGRARPGVRRPRRRPCPTPPSARCSPTARRGARPRRPAAMAAATATATGTPARSCAARAPATAGCPPCGDPTWTTRTTSTTSGRRRTSCPARSWLRLAAVLAAVVVLVLGIVFAFNLGRDSGDGTATDDPTTSGSASKSAPASKPVADLRGDRLRPARRPAPGEPRARVARRRRQGRHRLAHQHLLRRVPPAQGRRGPAGRPGQAGQGRLGQGRPARRRHLAGHPGGARRRGRAVEHGRPGHRRLGQGRGVRAPPCA